MAKSYSASRLTAYALISALESDLRSIAIEYLREAGTPIELMGRELYQTISQRLAGDYGNVSDPALAELLDFADFGGIVDFLNRHRPKLPSGVAAALGAVAPDLQKIAPIRNRVMHARPLQFDDLAITLDVVENVR